MTLLRGTPLLENLRAPSRFRQGDGRLPSCGHWQLSLKVLARSTIETPSDSVVALLFLSQVLGTMKVSRGEVKGIIRRIAMLTGCQIRCNDFCETS
jgi:hypothetical protein